ncbi:MAG TPA: bifunctional diguanylate cyclase/phosphodiesterase [Eoetvoesiella sp.]|uniref:bifunctional diguanylate cyclase/phosphodiesterase n=1 Tax=Eoetvoesiella sp. TaxID=1966355 RepID=UPI002BC5D6DD|nr:bifunctional diguanylate cyclase/phosphodiesterase [Eoetvoesiella sp.]HWK62179.1 bifunctional diguanylate cyclase/phosphodiesterase [Eoetvoesiella sp.]
MQNPESDIARFAPDPLRLFDRVLRALTYVALPAAVSFLPVLSLLINNDPQGFGPGSFHAIYMLEGGVLTLSLTLLLFAAISRKWLYVLFAGWLIGNLRITATSMGWDMQWLGQDIPVAALPYIRKLTCALYYLLTFTLFTELFKTGLAKTRQTGLLRLGMVPGIVLLAAVPYVPYEHFLQLMWWMAAAGVFIAAAIIYRVQVVAYSSDMLWYSAGMLVVIAAGTGVLEALSTLINLHILNTACIHIAATIVSSALIALVVTENERSERNKTITALVTLADHDPLTNTLNQRGIEKRTRNALHGLSRGEPFAMGYLDFGSLKTVNDLYGHTTGDDVLRQACARVSAKLESGQFLGRIGGSELILLLCNTFIDDAQFLAHAIMNDLQASPCYIGTRTLQLNASMGLVEVANPKQPPQEVILAAARACRLARRNGVNQIVVHEYADIAKAEHSQEFQLLREFSTGFSPRNLFLVMQPIMSLKNPFNSLDFEVLLRMRDANGKLVPTNTIIAAAEESGVAPALDKWIIQTTLEWLDKHQGQLGNTNFICLNMNGMSLNDQKFIDEFFSLLQLHRHIAHLLCIEITESVALKDLNDIHTFIEQLHSIGVRVALDDFGAGYTSFSYLKQLPADALKIDGSFIQSMTARPADVAIVEAIVALAHNLGMQSIAEWVEDCATLETLARLGVDYVQGYAVSHPKDPKEMLNARCVVDFIDDEATRAFISEHLGQEA